MFLWLISVFQFSVNELLVGATASALAAFALHAALKAAVVLRAAPSLAIGGPAPATANRARLVDRIPGPGASVGPQYVAGSLAPIPFRSSPRLPRDAQRALATLFISLTPNSVVLDMDRSNSILFFHELVAAPLPRYLRNLQDE